MPELVAVVTRGPIVESRHRADIVVADVAGRVVWSLGDPTTVSYWRSAAKPVQAVAVVASGAASRYGLGEREIAVMAGSHDGEPEQVEAVAGLLKKVGLNEGHLRCGVGPPLHKPTAEAMLAKGEPYRAIHTNCSGKHAGLLALSAHLGEPLDTYWMPTHRAQKAVLAQVAAFSGLPERDVVIGVDGCGVPVFGIPLAGMATAFARLACPGGGVVAAESEAAAIKVSTSMMRHPELVSGKGFLCTELMLAAPGTLVAKSGAEGVYCVGLTGRGLGLAIKMEDGSGRALGPVVISALAGLGFDHLLTADRLRHLRRIRVDNLRGEEVGAIESVLTPADVRLGS